jgi:hypothetical protein
MTLELLDRWLPEPAIRTHHRRDSLVGATQLWSAALTVRLSDTRLLGKLIRWRIPGTSADQSFDELFHTYPFTVFDGPEAFRNWDTLEGVVGTDALNAAVQRAENDAPQPDGPVQDRPSARPSR